MIKFFLFFCFFVLALALSVEGALSGIFLQLTDTHLLRVYGEGTDPGKDCIAGKSSGTAGEFGDYHCDTSYALKNFTRDSLKKRKKPDFILYTGDHIAITDPNESLKDAEWYIRDAAELLKDIRDAYGPDVRVFPMVGNHDSYPAFQFPESGPYFVYETAAEAWKEFLQPESLKTVRLGGYYTELIVPGLRIVVVNTAMFYFENTAFPNSLVDPGGQFAWLRRVLQKAKDAGEAVFIAAHVPPGATLGTDSDMWSSYNDQFVRALEGFNGNPVVASFYGHHHWATYRIITNENVTTATSQNAHVGFVASSLTPRSDVNPCFTEITYMPEYPYSVIDRSYQYVDLVEANKQGSLSWIKAKTYKELFNVDSLDVETMTEVIDRMRVDPDLFRAYYRDLFVYSPTGETYCQSDECKTRTLCSFNYTLYDTVRACFKRNLP